MSKAPYRHGDGSDCYTVNCSRGHYTSADAAIAKGDINAFLNAKENETKMNALPTTMIVMNGQPATVASLVMDGYKEEKVVAAFTRPVGTTKNPPEEKHIKNRINCLIIENDFIDKYNEIVTHEFPMFTSKKDKQEYYQNGLRDLANLNQNMRKAGNELMYGEQTHEVNYSDALHTVSADPMVRNELWDVPERQMQKRTEHLYTKLYEKLLAEKSIPPQGGSFRGRF